MAKLNDYINEMLRLAGAPMMESDEPLALKKGDTKIVKPSQSKGWEEIKTSDMEKESVPASKTGLPEFKYGEGGSLVKASSGKDSAGSSEPTELKGAEVKPCKGGECKHSHKEDKEDKSSEPKDEKKIDEGKFDGLKKKIKDHMPRAGFIKDEDGNREGAYLAIGPDELVKAAYEMANKLRDRGIGYGTVSEADVRRYIEKGHLLDDELEDEDEDNEDFEEYEEYDDYDEELDESVEDNEDFEQYETCSWCGQPLPKSEMKKEKDIGYLCNHCARGLESREGPLDFED